MDTKQHGGSMFLVVMFEEIFMRSQPLIGQSRSYVIGWWNLSFSLSLQVFVL